MSDRELLEAAARAAGIECEWHKGCGYALHMTAPDGTAIYWNPLKNDGDALRLAVKLSLAVTPYPIYEHPKHSVISARKSLENSKTEVIEPYGDDAAAATRLAIVRSAAAMAQEVK